MRPLVHPFLVLLALCASLTGYLVAGATPTSLSSHLQPNPADGNSSISTAQSVFEALAAGNNAFRANYTWSDAYDSHHFLYWGCSDSIISEGTIFKAEVGTFVVERNMANQFLDLDNSGQGAFGYAINQLGITHAIVMGHYGCSGVADAIATPPPPPIDPGAAAHQHWIGPVREIYSTSNRTEVVVLREKNEKHSHVDPPPFTDPGLRALIEENVRVNVWRMATSTVIQNLYHKFSRNETTEDHAVFIHGFLYDSEDGQVYNLGISVGPPGVRIPDVPFPLLPDFPRW
ncbi:hypothetical protein CVT26_006419 [Gymnopilus dilepis]|uniref:Carbonic anhydrase n=1 Tax=Gymnopilus dilepis TaxID=231916 RepID=A0A409Y216_9AGAR|nr:hypothetical protein CVT26_006419 [Gymnopilus dilepis]